MPQQDMSKRIGKSSSPMVNRVLQNAKNGQRVVSVPGAVKTSYNKQPVSVKP